MEADKDEDIINLMVYLLKDKVKAISEGSEKILSRKKRHPDETIKERVMGKVLK